MDDHPLSGLNVPVRLVRNDGNSEPIYDGMLSGTLDDRLAILTGVAKMPFRKGEELIVHASLPGRSIGFIATVTHLARRPAPHYFITIPSEFEDLDLRNAPRVATLIPARIGMGFGSEAREESPHGEDGALVNLSCTGCALSSRKAFGPNDRLQLEFSLPGLEKPIKLDITVVSHRGGVGLHIHGVRFEQDPSHDPSLRGLAAWLDRHGEFISPTVH